MTGTNSSRLNSLGHIDEIPIGVLDQSDPRYPSGLKQLAKAPINLYFRGNIQLAAKLLNNIAIVGTRHASIYGKTCTQQLVRALANYDATIVSGMAYGIDATAHEAAITTGLPTIAILGAGLLDNSVASNPLYKQILEHNGLIISEYEPYYPAQKHTFIDRNRIISALSFCTVVVEAPKNSGALITARRSTELARPLYALAGEINKTNMQGNMALISSGAAEPIFSAKLWAGGLQLPTREHQEIITSSNPLLKLLGNEPISSDQLLKLTGLSITELSIELSKLIAKGHIRKIFGQKYIRVD